MGKALKRECSKSNSIRNFKFIVIVQHIVKKRFASRIVPNRRWQEIFEFCAANIVGTKNVSAADGENGRRFFYIAGKTHIETSKI